MKEKKLYNGEITLIDDDAEIIFNQHSWCLDGKGYVCRDERIGKRTFRVYLHRYVYAMNFGAIPEKMEIDHINGIPLDNRLENLRLATHSENMMNQRKTRGSSKYKGVHWNKQYKKWTTGIKINKKVQYLGSFDNEEDAAEAYNKKAIELFGDRARLNVINR